MDNPWPLAEAKSSTAIRSGSAFLTLASTSKSTNVFPQFWTPTVMGISPDAYLSPLRRSSHGSSKRPGSYRFRTVSWNLVRSFVLSWSGCPAPRSALESSVEM